MADVRKAVQWRSCSKGHAYLGQECPCASPQTAIERASVRRQAGVRRGRGEKRIEYPELDYPELDYPELDVLLDNAK